jgi:hypothetical protein
VLYSKYAKKKPPYSYYISERKFVAHLLFETKFGKLQPRDFFIKTFNAGDVTKKSLKQLYPKHTSYLVFYGSSFQKCFKNSSIKSGSSSSLKIKNDWNLQNAYLKNLLDL